MSSEVTVILKDESRTYKEKFLVYATYTLSNDDELIKDCIQKASRNFNGEPDDIQIRALLVVK